MVHYIIYQKEIIDLLSIQAKQKGIQISLVSNISSKEVYSDSNRIKQILLNFLSNSLKFTNEGKIQVIVEEMKDEDPNQGNQDISVLKISVQDTGVGIPDHIKPKLFNMHATFDHNNGSNKHGAGIGLVICKKLIGLLGPSDNVQLESQVGQGTKFSFSIYQYWVGEVSVSQHNSLLRSQQQYSSFKSEIIYTPKRKILLPPTLKMPQAVVFPQKSLEVQSQEKNQPLSRLVSHPKSQIDLYKQLLVQFSKDQLLEIQEDVQGTKSQNIEQTIIGTRNRTQNSFHDKRKLQDKRVTLECQFLPTIVVNDVQCTPKDQLLYNLLCGREQPLIVFILVVDDQVFNVMAFKLILRKYSRIQIDEAYDGEHALRMINQKTSQGESYKCIFMDLCMPIMDGLQTAKIITNKIQDGQLSKMFLIALSGHDDEKEKDSCQKAGFDAFLSKPIQISKVLEALDELSCIKHDF